MRSAGIFITILIVVAAIGLFVGYSLDSDPAKVELSADQQELVDEAGQPDTFIIIKDGGQRDEIWNYYSMQTSFYFSDGDYVRADNTLEPLPADAELPDYKPTDFPPGIDFAEVGSLAIGEPITTKMKIKDFGAIETRQYTEGLFIGVKDGALAFVQTQAFRRSP